MSDLVKRLRELSGPRYPDDICGKQLMGSAADRIERLEAVLVQAREAMNDIGLDCASQVAGEYHAAMAGYRQSRHDALDADVETMKSAIAAIDAALKE